MAEWMTNMFVCIGVYSFIATVWRLYEQIRYGHTNPNGRDAVICLVVSLFVAIMLYSWGVQT